jgi:hypothetical protein
VCERPRELSSPASVKMGERHQVRPRVASSADRRLGYGAPPPTPPPPPLDPAPTPGHDVRSTATETSLTFGPRARRGSPRLLGSSTRSLEVERWTGPLPPIPARTIRRSIEPRARSADRPSPRRVLPAGQATESIELARFGHDACHPMTMSSAVSIRPLRAYGGCSGRESNLSRPHSARGPAPESDPRACRQIVDHQQRSRPKGPTASCDRSCSRTL